MANLYNQNIGLGILFLVFVAIIFVVFFTLIYIGIFKCVKSKYGEDKGRIAGIVVIILLLIFIFIGMRVLITKSKPLPPKGERLVVLNGY